MRAPQSLPRPIMPGPCPPTQNHRRGIRASWNGDILLKWTPYSQERLGLILLFGLNPKVKPGLDPTLVCVAGSAGFAVWANDEAL